MHVAKKNLKLKKTFFGLYRLETKFHKIKITTGSFFSSCKKYIDLCNFSKKRKSLFSKKEHILYRPEQKYTTFFSFFFERPYYTVQRAIHRKKFIDELRFLSQKTAEFFFCLIQAMLKPHDFFFRSEKLQFFVSWQSVHLFIYKWFFSECDRVDLVSWFEKSGISAL